MDLKIERAIDNKVYDLVIPIIKLTRESVTFEKENQDLKEENANLRAEIATLKNRPSFDALQKIRAAINKKIKADISGNIKEMELLKKQRKARYRLIDDVKLHLQIRSIEHITDEQLEDALKFIENYSFDSKLSA